MTLEPQTARSRFKLGDPVAMTRLGMRELHGEVNRDFTIVGIVTGFCRNQQMINITIIGHKIQHSYHVDYWSRVAVRSLAGGPQGGTK